MKVLKRTVSLFLCVLLLLSPLTCSAATITLTPEEKARWTQNSNILDRKLEVLELNSEQSQKDLLIAEEKLRVSEEKLARHEALLLQYESALQKTQLTLQKLEDSLTKTVELLKKERNEHKKQVNRLKTEKIVWTILGIGAGLLAGKYLGK